MKNSYYGWHHVTDLLLHANSERPTAEPRASGDLLFLSLGCPGMMALYIRLVVTMGS